VEYAFFAFFLVYLAPFTVAASRGHPRVHRILALNLALGWTGFGWVAALVWACPPRRRRRRPPLRLVAPETTGPPARPVPSLGVLAAVAAWGVAAGGGDALPSAAWWPERQAPAPATVAAREVVGRAGALVHARPEPGAARGARLPPGCAVRVLRHARGWKQVWPARGCAPTGGRARGWIRALRASPPGPAPL